MKNHTWMSTIELHSLGYHRASGQLSVVNSSVNFDPEQGIASFNNLQINAKGMYILVFSVYSTNGEYSFKCLSKSITVTAADDIAMSYSTNSAPEYIIKFEGEYDSIDGDEVKANVYNFMLGYNIGIGNIQVYQGSVYVSFYSSEFNSNLTDTLIASGLTVDPNLSFSYANINGETIGCTNCVSVSY